MPILIKNMEMPSGCRSCFFYRQRGGAWMCTAAYPERWKATSGAGKPDWCPLVEIPITKSPMTDKELEEVGFEL